MEAFLRSLSLNSSTTVDDATYPCMRILDWIKKTSLSPQYISYKDVENIGKGLVYLNGCYELFQEELPKRLIELFPFYEEQVKTFFCIESSKRYKSISDIIERIGQSSKGSENIFILESILNAPYETNEVSIPLEYSLKDAYNKNCFDFSKTTLKMHTLVNKIFQLPNEQIDIAIDRMLDYMPFCIVGLIFCESRKSIFSDECIIIAHRIYEKLLNGKISALFLGSLYFYSSISESGKKLFWNCLKNPDFQNGLSSFFLRALTFLSKLDIDFDTEISLILFEGHRISHVLYLIWAALSRQSPCHVELYKNIENAGLNNVIYVFNKLERIFE